MDRIFLAECRAGGPSDETNLVKDASLEECDHDEAGEERVVRRTASEVATLVQHGVLLGQVGF